MTTLRALRARPVLVPIRRPPVSASGAIPKAALVLFDLETDDGVTGRSYVFGFTVDPVVHRRLRAGVVRDDQG